MLGLQDLPDLTGALHSEKRVHPGALKCTRVFDSERNRHTATRAPSVHRWGTLVSSGSVCGDWMRSGGTDYAVVLAYKFTKPSSSERTISDCLLT
jgi:hypothetical protein